MLHPEMSRMIAREIERDRIALAAAHGRAAGGQGASAAARLRAAAVRLLRRDERAPAPLTTRAREH